MNYWKNIYRNRHILVVFTRQSLLAKYRHSFLGVMWAWLMPLGMVLIMGFVFGTIFSRDHREFIPFLFSGLMPWSFITSCMDAGAGSFVSAEGYIKQIRLPLEIFPARATAFNFVNMLISLCAFYLVVLLVSPGTFTAYSLFVLPALLTLAVLGVSIATISAVFNTFVRDFAPLQALMLQALFYFTPIIYPAEMMTNRGYAWVVKCNPLYYIMEMIRNPLLGRPPQLRAWLVTLAVVAGLNFFAMHLIRRTRNKIVMQL